MPKDRHEAVRDSSKGDDRCRPHREPRGGNPDDPNERRLVARFRRHTPPGLDRLCLPDDYEFEEPLIITGRIDSAACTAATARSRHG